MAAGDKELFQAFEETTRRNIQAAVVFSNETRRIVREMEQKIERIETLLLSKDAELKQIHTMLSALQTRVFAGGTE